MRIKVLAFLLAIASMFVVFSCTQKSNEVKADNEKAVADTIVKDSIVAEDVVEPEPIFVTPDLAFMEVHGHVKSVVYPNGRKAVFDEKGNLIDYATEYSGENKVHIGRDDEGYIVSTYDGPGGSESFDYDKENVRLALTAAGDGAYYSECHLEYDKDGNIIRYNFVDEDRAEDIHDEWSADVEIVKKDEHGNWIELKSGEASVKRTIEYFSK